MKSRSLTADDGFDLGTGWSAAMLTVPGDGFAVDRTPASTISLTAVVPDSLLPALKQADSFAIIAEIEKSGGFLHSFKHRTTGELLPSMGVSFRDGSAVLRFHNHGAMNRSDVPSEIRQAASGQKVQEDFYVDGVLHADDAPASIRYFLRNGKLANEDFYQRGVIQSSRGYAPNGAQTSELQYRDGVLVPTEEAPGGEVVEFAPVAPKPPKAAPASAPSPIQARKEDPVRAVVRENLSAPGPSAPHHGKLAAPPPAVLVGASNMDQRELF
jgi:hypothetical protein